MTILVVGAAGRLGSAVVRQFAGWADVTPTVRGELDVCDRRAVLERVAALRPAAIVNCTAFNDVDRAEDEPVEALRVNAFAVRTLAEAARAAGAALVHYSTDFVFDGETDRPYREEDPPNPQSAYACSKLLGEWLAAGVPRHYVLRVESLFGGPAEPVRPTSVDRIVEGILAGREVRVFADRTVSPSYNDDVAGATRALLERGAAPGLYHCVNSGSCTWLELALEVGRQLGVEPRLLPVRVADVALRARRPRYCALSNARLAAAGAAMPAWQDALARHLAERRQAPPAGRSGRP
jgi:dTDP-4-dehydrorhamnose reductase